MRLSIVIAVLDSHEIVHRQLLYFASLGLPKTVEFILVDDGSTPPIADPWRSAEGQEHNDEPDRLHGEDDIGGAVSSAPFNFRLLHTQDFRRWTQGLARMKGIAEAQGEYILCTDIDHIISKEAIDAALETTCDKMVFPRWFGLLNQNGELMRDLPSLIDWGLLPAAIRHPNLSDGVHGNTWLMRKSVFEELGGYSLKRCNSETHLQGEDRDFNHRWGKAQRAGRFKPQVAGPPIYFFPMGRYHVTGDENPHGLFHTMKKEKWGQS